MPPKLTDVSRRCHTVTNGVTCRVLAALSHYPVPSRPVPSRPVLPMVTTAWHRHLVNARFADDAMPGFSQ